jgi:hypothetical protein
MSTNPGCFPPERTFIWREDKGKSEKVPAPNVASMKSSAFHGTYRFLAMLSDL